MKITVIVPAYNVEKYIEKCIESILNQSFSDFELILVNDGSTDGTLEICNKFSCQDKRIKIIDKKNEGVAIARNIGLAQAQGEYVTFVDSDDYLALDCLETAYNLACSSEADLVVWALCDIYMDGTCKYYQPIKGKQRCFEKEQIQQLINMIISCKSETGDSASGLAGPYCKLIKTDLAKSCFFPENLSWGEDTYYVIQILKKSKKIQYVNNFFYNRQVRENSLSFDFDRKTIKRISDYVQLMISYLINNRFEKWVINDYYYAHYRLVVLRSFIFIKDKNYSEIVKYIQNYEKSVDYVLDYSDLQKDCSLKEKIICSLIKKRKFFILYLMCNVVRRVWCFGEEKM